MTVYGDIPGVRIETSTGTLSGVTIGTESILTLIGVGEIGGSAPENEAVQVSDRAELINKFSDDTDLSVAFDQATANGANPDFLYAVKASTQSVTETSDTVSEKTLSDIPVPNKENITVTETTGSTELNLEFRYEDTVPVPEDTSTVYLNPSTGDFEDDVADTIEFEYDTVDWTSAIEAAAEAFEEGQFGIIQPLTSEEQAGTALTNTLDTMRNDELKMAVGIIGADPNKTVLDEHPGYDTTDIEARFDDDTIFSVAGASLADRTPSQPGFGTDVLGAVGGLFAGNPNTDPVYDDTLVGVGRLAQRFSRADVTGLRDGRIIPLRDTGTVRVADNRSTYESGTEPDWERDFFRRRIVDLVTVTVYRIARRQIGGILDSDTVDDVEDAVGVELAELVDDGLLEAGGQNVTAFRDDDRTIGLDLEISPLGVAKSADVSLEVIA
jgi:hypothetical protein